MCQALTQVTASSNTGQLTWPVWMHALMTGPANKQVQLVGLHSMMLFQCCTHQQIELVGVGRTRTLCEHKVSSTVVQACQSKAETLSVSPCAGSSALPAFRDTAARL